MNVDGIYYAKAAAFIAAAIAMGLGTIGPALGQGLVGMKACENLGKYPESGSQIRTTMILALGLIETVAIYALLIAGFILWLSRSLV